MQQYANIYLLQSHSICFGCHSTHHQELKIYCMSLEFYSNVDMHINCLIYLHLNMQSILRAECWFQSLFVLHCMDVGRVLFRKRYGRKGRYGMVSGCGRGS